MSDVVDKIDLSSRFFEYKISRCVDLLFVSNSEFNFEFKLFVVLIGPGVVYFLIHKLVYVSYNNNNFPSTTLPKT